jgi:hypothetical protein
MTTTVWITVTALLLILTVIAFGVFRDSKIAVRKMSLSELEIFITEKLGDETYWREIKNRILESDEIRHSRNSDSAWRKSQGFERIELVRDGKVIDVLYTAKS